MIESLVYVPHVAGHVSIGVFRRIHHNIVVPQLKLLEVVNEVPDLNRCHVPEGVVQRLVVVSYDGIVVLVHSALIHANRVHLDRVFTQLVCFKLPRHIKIVVIIQRLLKKVNQILGSENQSGIAHIVHGRHGLARQVPHELLVPKQYLASLLRLIRLDLDKYGRGHEQSEE